MKLALGTAQFGLDYGITNSDGKTSPEEMQKIIHMASDNNIFLYDTANGYGDSEIQLGKVTEQLNKIQFISKFIVPETEAFDINQAVRDSLNKLQHPNLYGFLFHNENDLLSNQGERCYQQLLELKANGKIKKIGASFYTLQALEKALNNYKLDLIQIPASCLDQRFQKSGLLAEAQKQNIEVHARSLFLQGLLLDNNVQLPDTIKKFKKHLDYYFKTAKQLNLTPLELALLYLQKTDEINYGVVGCQNDQQLLGIINAYNNVKRDVKRDVKNNKYDIDLSCLSVNETRLLNPSLWFK